MIEMRQKVRTPVGVSCLVILASLALSPALRAQGAETSYRLALQSDSRLWIEGGSSMHDWSCEASRFEAELHVTADAAQGLPSRLEEARVRVPVAQLECDKSQMDGNLQKALEMEDHPVIEFRTRAPLPLPGDAPGETVTVPGELTVAGETRPVQLGVTARPADQRISVEGSHELLMTDFGIDPPTAFLGVLKTRDSLTVRFDLNLAYEPWDGAAASEQSRGSEERQEK